MNLSNINSNDVEKAKLQYQSCVESRESTTLAFATENIKSLLKKLSQLEPPCKKMMEVALMEALIQPCDKVLTSTTALDDNGESSFLNTEAQLLLRLQFWASLGGAFVCRYKKAKLSRKKKRRHRSQPGVAPSHLLFNDVCDLLSMLAMRLTQNKPFASFLQDCLHQSFCDRGSKLPKGLFGQIYRHFEIRDPQSDIAEEFVDFASIKGALPQTRQKRRDSMSTASSGTSSSGGKLSQKSSIGSEKGDAKLLQDNKGKKRRVTHAGISLVAPKQRRNSLLGDGPSHFVGSHFNTSLTNVTSLFREVRPTGRQTRVSNPSILSLAERAREQPPTLKPCLSAQTTDKMNHAAPLETGSAKRKPQCFQVPTAKRSKASNTVRIAETPALRRAKPNMLDVRRVVVEARSALRRQK
jgi:hypothetical protein